MKPIRRVCGEMLSLCGAPELELELELIQTQMTQKPMLRVEVGARALRSSAACGCARSSVCVGPSKPGSDRKKE